MKFWPLEIGSGFELQWVFSQWQRILPMEQQSNPQCRPPCVFQSFFRWTLPWNSHVLLCHSVSDCCLVHVMQISCQFAFVTTWSLLIMPFDHDVLNYKTIYFQMSDLPVLVKIPFLILWMNLYSWWCWFQLYFRIKEHKIIITF